MDTGSIPQSPTTLETLWEASRAGLITWASVQQYQANLMPRCANHPDRSAATIEAGQAVCAACYVAIVAARREETTHAMQ